MSRFSISKISVPSRILLSFVLIFMGFCFGLLLSNKSYPLLGKLRSDLKAMYTQFITKQQLWNNGFDLVNIPSTLDGTDQSAYIYKTTSSSREPLIVSLHTWSGNYVQFDSLALLCKERNINYIHPDFRGPNTNGKACNSKFVISDIDDAIDFAAEHALVDPKKIVVVGGSGGGYTALGVYMKSRSRISGFSVWASISDLEAWYKQGLVRNSRLVEDILACTQSENTVLNTSQAIQRSPIHWETPREKALKTTLKLYAGIYDGIRGSVPITQSINFYNKIIKDLGAKDSTNYVSDREKRLLLEYRKPLGSFGYLQDRKKVLEKRFGKIELIIYEGGHEILDRFALEDILNTLDNR